LDQSHANPLQKSGDAHSNPLETLLKKLDRKRRIEAIKIIRETTKKLPEKDQLLIRLVFGSGHPMRVAAKIIDLSTAAARRRLKGLLLKYREILLAAGIREP
jgi:DNA-directed RNA polymerase specialized sigma24 family protein